MEQKIATFMDYQELDELVKKVYGVEWEFCADVESANDSSHTFLVRKQTLDEYDIKRLLQFKAGIHVSYITHTLLDDLCNNGHLAEGLYLIEVCW